jgi:hypothetical protein
VNPAEFNRAWEERPERRSYSRVASAKQRRETHALALRLGIEPPSVMWRSQVRDATRRLAQNLTHHQQPSLLDQLAIRERESAR